MAWILAALCVLATAGIFWLREKSIIKGINERYIGELVVSGNTIYMAFETDTIDDIIKMNNKVSFVKVVVNKQDNREKH